MKNGNSNFGFSYMANFEAFLWNFSSSTNLKIGRSGVSRSSSLSKNLTFHTQILICPNYSKQLGVLKCVVVKKGRENYWKQFSYLGRKIEEAHTRWENKKDFHQRFCGLIIFMLYKKKFGQFSIWEASEVLSLWNNSETKKFRPIF